MLVIYPLLGIDAFAPPSFNPESTTLHMHGRGITAIGLDSAEGFIVQAGSHAAGTEVPSLGDWVRKLRATLRENGVLTPEGDQFRLTQDYTFTSPSLAAAVMLGRSANGRAEWMDAQNRTLKTLQEAEAAK
jgi:hypothetical protein